jgi:hypothetical protein
LAGMVMESWRHFRTNFGRVHAGFLESRSGLIMGDSRPGVFSQPFLHREEQSLRPPSPFSREDFLSSLDNGRDRLIRVQSGLGWKVKETGNHQRSPNDSRAKIEPSSRSEIRADFGRFQDSSLLPNNATRLALPGILRTSLLERR